MLFIWDVHITTKRQAQLLEQISSYIEKFSHEKTIIFMGDFVYQFSYDRKALLWLFHLFTKLYKQGKHVYVVAWNHDRIADHFAYEEAKQAFDIAFGDVDNTRQTGGILKFITQPTFEHIEWQDVLFFPFTHHFDQNVEIDKKSSFYELSLSSLRNERLSAQANSVLRKMLEERRTTNEKSKKLLLIHHRYIVETAFPWQQAKFGFGSPGLSQQLLEMDDLLLVSWHLHQPFVDRNYLCTGSIWHTSSLEVNQQKRFFQCDPIAKILHSTPVSINPFVMIQAQENEPITLEQLSEKIYEMRNKSRTLLMGWSWDVTKDEKDEPINFSTITLLISSASWTYQDLDKYLAPGVLDRLKDVKLKSISSASGKLLTDLEKGALALDQSISDWKSLLRLYLQRKYADRAASYEQFLHDLELL